MSSRPFLAHTDAPTPPVHARPSFVPALKLGGGGAGGGSRVSAPPPRPFAAAPMIVKASAPAPAPAGARAAFRPGGGGVDSSNVYIYRQPTQLYRPPVAAPFYTTASGAPALGPAPSATNPAGGISRGPPSANESKLIGGAGRDYNFPAKSDYTPIGPRNAPFHQVAAGGRPVTNAFRTPATTPAIRTFSRGPRPKRPKPAKVKSSKPAPKDGEAADDENDADDAMDDGDDNVEDEDDDDNDSYIGPSGMKRASRPGADRPSSAFRGASPRAPPPDAFEPDWEGLNNVMTVTSRASVKRGLPGASKSKKTSKASSAAASKAPSVAGSARSGTSAKPDVKDENDPFAEDDDEAMQKDGDANAAAAGDSPRSHRSLASHASARSNVSQHSAGWYTRQFHLTGDVEKDMATLQAKAASLQAQVAAQKKAAAAAAKPEEEEKTAPEGDEEAPAEEEEEEVLAEDGDANGEEEEPDQSEEVDDGAEDEEQQPEEDGGEEEPHEEDETAEEEKYAAAPAKKASKKAVAAAADSADENDPFAESGDNFQPDDLSEGEQPNQIGGSDAETESVPVTNKKAPVRDPFHSDTDHEEEAKAAPTGGEKKKKVLRPSNAWASKDPVSTLPQLYTKSQWGEQTRKEMMKAGMERSGGPLDGNETSDIDTEQSASENENEEDNREKVLQEKLAAKAAAQRKQAPGSDDDKHADDSDMDSTALFVVQKHATKARHALAPPSAAAASKAAAPVDSEEEADVNVVDVESEDQGDDGPDPTQVAKQAAAAAQSLVSDSDDEGLAVLTNTASSKNLFSSIMQGLNKKGEKADPVVKKALSASSSRGKLEKGQPTPPKTPSSAPAADPFASPSTAASTEEGEEPPVVDYMAVLKRKGVLEVVEAQSEATATKKELLSTEEKLAQLRAREKELMELKWKQVQAAEQAAFSPSSTARSTASTASTNDPFASPPQTAKKSSKPETPKTPKSPKSPSTQQQAAASSSALPPTNPDLGRTGSSKLQKATKIIRVAKLRHAVAPREPSPPSAAAASVAQHLASPRSSEIPRAHNEEEDSLSSREERAAIDALDQSGDSFNDFAATAAFVPHTILSPTSATITTPLPQGTGPFDAFEASSGSEIPVPSAPGSVAASPSNRGGLNDSMDLLSTRRSEAAAAAPKEAEDPFASDVENDHEHEAAAAQSHDQFADSFSAEADPEPAAEEEEEEDHDEHQAEEEQESSPDFEAEHKMHKKTAQPPAAPTANEHDPDDPFA